MDDLVPVDLVDPLFPQMSFLSTRFSLTLPRRTYAVFDRALRILPFLNGSTCSPIVSTLRRREQYCSLTFPTLPFQVTRRGYAYAMHVPPIHSARRPP